MLCDVTRNEIKVLALLIILAIPLYTSIELCNFIIDQYTFQSCIKENGFNLTNDTEQYINTIQLESDKEKLTQVQSKVAFIEACSNCARLLTSLFTTFMFTILVDLLGIRVVFIIMIIGEMISIISMSLYVLLQADPWFAILPGILESLFGSGMIAIAAQISNYLIYLTNFNHENSNTQINEDCSQKHLNLWLLFVIFDGIANFCSSLGELIGGYLIHNFGFLTSVIICLSIFVPCIFVIFIIPNPQSDMQCKKSEEFQFTSIENLNKWKLTCEKTSNYFIKIFNLPTDIRLLIVITFLGYVAALSDLHFMFIYLMGAPFYWNAEKVGIYMGITGMTCAVLSVILTTLVIIGRKNKINTNSETEVTEENYTTSPVSLINMFVSPKPPDFTVIQLLLVILFLSLIVMIINRLMIGMAELFVQNIANLFIYLAAIFKLGKTIIISVLRTIFSVLTTVSSQGIVNSVNAGVTFIGLLVSLTILPLIYSATVNSCPGTVFFTCAVLLFIASIINIVLIYVIKRKYSTVDISEDRIQINIEPRL